MQLSVAKRRHTKGRMDGVMVGRTNSSAIMETEQMMSCRALALPPAAAAILMILLTPGSAPALMGFDSHGSGPGYPPEANGRLTNPPTLEAHRIQAGGIRVDGRLDEADWMAAPAASGFSQFEPDRLSDPCEDTVFKILYDDDAIYFGVACLRQNGEPVTSCLSRRDNITSSDRIRIYIDPYHDRTTGYHFRINPHGVKEDYYNYGDLYHDISWNAVWEADTHIDEDGWYAEIRVPFSSIRYRAAESMTWGFNVFQYVQSRGQQTAWSNWRRDQQGFMSRSGTITGIRGIRPPRQLEVTPYVVSSTTDPSDPSNTGWGEEDWDDTANIGADIKYGVTADLTLNATIQPDFGQIEADPSVLNLSPHETYYDEKRPFFVEGAQFFWHPSFTVFYSRRIGTGSQNSRIRGAAKLTGKLSGDISSALLIAATDETGEGQTHNPFKGGLNRAWYAIGRFGKQFRGGTHSVNIMQTAVLRDRTSFDHPVRNGYVSGGDFELNFRDRMYQISGSFVGSIVDPLKVPGESSADPSPTYGHGGRFEITKASGDWRWALTTRLQSDELDINDLGYIRDPDHYAGQAWVTRVFNSDDDESVFSNASLHLRYYKSWIYAGRSAKDPDDPGRTLWSYESGHRQLSSLHFDGSLGSRSCWDFWGGAEYNLEGTDIFATRRVPGSGDRGPLMTSPAFYEGWIGFSTDHRRDLQFSTSMRAGRDVKGSRTFEFTPSLNWIQNDRINHSLQANFEAVRADAQWIGNLVNPDGGIGGVSYLFSRLDQRTWDLTLRSNVLFDRDKSLEVYLQPFLTTGDYRDPRELARPDSYELRPYGEYDAAQDDFAFGAVNLNTVFRWEYRPGSTLFLVWAHSREDFSTRGTHSGSDPFDNGFSTGPIFDQEAQNRLMIKISYWIPV